MLPSRVEFGHLRPNTSIRQKLVGKEKVFIKNVAQFGYVGDSPTPVQSVPQDTERTQPPPEPEIVFRNPTSSLSVLLESKAATRASICLWAAFVECTLLRPVHHCHAPQLFLMTWGPQGYCQSHCWLCRDSIGGTQPLRLFMPPGLVSAPASISEAEKSTELQHPVGSHKGMHPCGMAEHTGLSFGTNHPQLGKQGAAEGPSLHLPSV